MTPKPLSAPGPPTGTHMCGAPTNSHQDCVDSLLFRHFFSTNQVPVGRLPQNQKPPFALRPFKFGGGGGHLAVLLLHDDQCRAARLVAAGRSVRLYRLRTPSSSRQTSSPPLRGRRWCCPWDTHFEARLIPGGHCRLLSGHRSAGWNDENPERKRKKSN